MCTLLWAIQDYLIFPGTGYSSGSYKVPDGVLPFTISTVDGQTLEVWHYPVLAPRPATALTTPPSGSSFTPTEERTRPDVVAIVFHGNGNILPFTKDMHRILASNSIASYAVDYRGYGNSSGWPSEEGLYKDAQALWEFAKERHSNRSTRFIVWGISIGGGPATFLAERIKPDALVLTATFSSLSDIVQENLIYYPFSWVLSHHFPTKERLSRFRNSCITLVHGEQDEVIPYSHMLRNREAIHESNKTAMVSIKDADHNSIVITSLPKVLQETLACIKP